MSYRYSTTDIIVGVGMCAIVFGALLFFLVANGTIQAAPPQPLLVEQQEDSLAGVAFLQPVLGQAIVDALRIEQQAYQAVAQSVSEWNRATLTHQAFQAHHDGPFGAVARQAVTLPIEHAARVQGVMGRSIVNFTQRGVRTGALSADYKASAFNTDMIRATERRGQNLHDEFASTWQATLGRNIVNAIQNYRTRTGAMQEQLGTAAVHVTQAQYAAEQGGRAEQSQLGSLLVAGIRTNALVERLTLLAAIESSPEEIPVAATTPAAWPEMPMGYLIAAGLLLTAVFFGGLSFAARSRELQALAKMQHDSNRWVYRMAA